MMVKKGVLSLNREKMNLDIYFEAKTAGVIGLSEDLISILKINISETKWVTKLNKRQKVYVYMYNRTIQKNKFRYMTD